jgi:hypothetical protein
VIEGCDKGYRAYSEMFVVFLSSKKVSKLVEDGYLRDGCKGRNSLLSKLTWFNLLPDIVL